MNDGFKKISIIWRKKMKKLVSLVLALSLVLGLTGCGGSGGGDSSSGDSGAASGQK